MVTPENLYLAVDLGGTKTALAVYAGDDPGFTPLATRRYPSAAFSGVEEIIRRFLAEHRLAPRAVCLAVAGVVEAAEARVTNLPWVVRKETLHHLGFSSVTLINDLTAVAAALPLLGETDLFRLREGRPSSGAVRAILAPGTGLGEGYLLSAGGCDHPCGTEGGHSDFAPVDAEQRDLLTWFADRSTGTVSYEAVCSGSAIATLYDFYLSRGSAASARVRREVAAAADRTPVIVEAALSGDCPLCGKVINLFLTILGREGASLVLKTYATGGLYLGGGLLPRLVGRISWTPFLEAFLRPGAMSELLETIPVHLITRSDTGLLGAARYGLRLAVQSGIT